jgi:hypothetical protein
MQDDAHSLCVNAKDYKGCIEANQGEHPDKNDKYTKNPNESWSQFLIDNDLLSWSKAYPQMAEGAKFQWEQGELLKAQVDYFKNMDSNLAQESNNRCPTGKRYYELEEGVTFFGIRVGKPKVSWSGCLSDYEAAQMGFNIQKSNQESQQRILERMQDNIQKNRSVTCYGNTNTYGTGAARSSTTRTTCY